MTTCPKCHAELEAAVSVCPECGVRLLRNVSGIVKTSVVLISAGGEDALYRSVHDVPEPLRRQLMETTAGDNSGTIVIADRAGKEQLTQVLARREANRETNLPDPVSEPAGRRVIHRLSSISWIAWGGLLLILFLAGIASAFFGLRW